MTNQLKTALRMVREKIEQMPEGSYVELEDYADVEAYKKLVEEAGFRTEIDSDGKMFYVFKLGRNNQGEHVETFEL